MVAVVSLLQLNQLLRDIFELGPPLMLDRASIRASKISRFEKVSLPCLGSQGLGGEGALMSEPGTLFETSAVLS